MITKFLNSNPDQVMTGAARAFSGFRFQGFGFAAAQGLALNPELWDLGSSGDV